jgi:uncharacterized protein YjbJ (UPF0337 family)
MKDSTINQGKGKMRELKGRAKEGYGVATDNPDLTSKGRGEKVAGKLQKKAGDIEQVFDH